MTDDEKISILIILLIGGLFILCYSYLTIDSQYTYENKTTKLLEKEESTYTQCIPIFNGKTVIMVPQIQHGYWFKTEYRDLMVSMETYDKYDVNDTIPVRINTNTSDVNVIC